MDINEKIAQRRREIEAKKIIDAPIEQAIIQQAVQKNLEAHGSQAGSGAQSEALQDDISPQKPHEHLDQKIAEATEGALDQLAMKRFTVGQWMALGTLVGMGMLFLFGLWPLSLVFFFGAWKYFKHTLSNHRFLMKYDPTSVSMKPGGLPYAKSDFRKK